MQTTADNIPLLPISIFLYDPRGDQWRNNDHLFLLDKNLDYVFKGTITNGKKNMYNINLKEGKYSIFLDRNINRNLVSWDIYININGTLKNICSSDNYNCDNNDDCYPDTFIITLDDFNQHKVINADVANIKEATVDTLDVKTIKLGTNLLSSSNNEYSLIKNLNVSNISFENLPYNLKLEKYPSGKYINMYRLIYAAKEITEWINHDTLQKLNIRKINTNRKINNNIIFTSKIKKTKNMSLSFPVKKKN